MKVLLTACLLFASTSFSYAQTVRVWTHTDTFTSEEQKLRERAVADITKRLVKKHLTLADDAPISIEVQGTERTEERDNLGALANVLNGAAGGYHQRQNEKKLVTWRFATLTLGTYTTTLRGNAFDRGVSLSKAIATWMEMNKNLLQK